MVMLGDRGDAGVGRPRGPLERARSVLKVPKVHGIKFYGGGGGVIC